MATVAEPVVDTKPRPDRLSGTPRAHALDRWIYVITAASFIAIVLAGFIPTSLEKIAAVEAGRRPPFPLVLHLHALLMGAFLLLLFAQTALVATGRSALHQRLGLASLVLAPAIVVVGFILVPTSYHEMWSQVQSAPLPAGESLHPALTVRDNVMLLQLRIGILFPICLTIALLARRTDSGLHKRMMILATAMALPAGFDRIPWIWSTMPVSPVSPDLYTLLALSPLFVWDVLRNRYVHRAYWIWLALFLPFAVLVHGLWDTAWWHGAARQLMGL